ncbi:MAG: response regulator transcription factor [Akkermansiaceae bacterium]|nr:response regulator transcription factor [Verrucomicrobiales bacterium]
MSKLLNIRVSIIEDDVSVGQILSGWISEAKGFRFLSRHITAGSALMQLPKEKPDVVLADINLPDLNGIQCVTRLKLVLPETQFVMLTVYEDTDHIFDALKAGATGYLLKQTDRAELLTSIKEVHEGGSPMSSYIARKVVQCFHRRDEESSVLSILTNREREVLKLLAEGYYYKEIADLLQIGIPTVNTYIRAIYNKLQVTSRGRAVAKYTQSVSK